ncbi:choice-of-anchor M domain-containing protein [Cellulosimicrobium sp. NPDC057127]|uniref:choice-of-anchor M domain-containing protein n=1 Tax=Cellulosimicrobium sp. NPDC057127 TaxID=3346026 RepID=UPI003636A957
MHTRSRVVGAALGAATLLATALAPTAAVAAEGPPPPSTELQVLSRVHTDAVSTFLEEGALELGTKADLPAGNGTRLDPATVLFHVDDASRRTVAAGYEFVGPVGSPMWVSPEANPSGGDGYTQLWPGFSTESVPAGALVDDTTTFVLTDVRGPGDLELFSGGGLEDVRRLWSSDEDISSFQVGHTHMHANWAFTAPGRYALDVRAEATTAAGTPVSAEGTYTFVVGPMVPATTTSTTLAVDATSVQPGDAVALDATVSPADAPGWVEFLDGEDTLGHAEVTDGSASLTISTLPLGERSLTARFIPEVTNDFSASTSEARVVTVTEEPGGETFGIAGLRESWAAGEMIELGATGVTLGEGESLRWIIRSAPGDTEYVATSGESFVRDATTALDGAEIMLELRGTVDGRGTTLAETPYHPLTVTGPDVGSGAPVTLTGIEDSYFVGDPMTVTAEHAPLADGQTYRWVMRGVPYGLEWGEVYTVPGGDNPFTLDPAWVRFSEVALQIVDADGTVVGQSPAIHPDTASRELQLSGARSVYRAGETMELASELHPARDGLTHAWSVGTSLYASEPIASETGTTVSVPVTADMDGQKVFLVVTDTATGFRVAQADVVVRVTDAAPGEQLVLLDGLAGHYHQGSTISLRATADPVASDSDTYLWEWKRPDQDAWTPIPGATAAAHDVTAEQALDGTQVRTTLVRPDGTELATSETVTIHVDDHGAPPRQKAAVTSLHEWYAVGDRVELDATVTPASVLDRWEWYVQRPGSDTPARLEDTLTSHLAFEATEELDGAALFARLTFDDGRPYVESPPVVLAIDPATDPEPTDPGTDPTDPGPEPTDPEPTDPGTEPTDPGTDPTDPGTEPGPTDPGTVPSGEKPDEAPAGRTAADLGDAPEGGVEPSTTTPRQGEVITVSLGAEHAGAWVAAWLFSEPTLLGRDWLRADAEGDLAIRIPVGTPPGDHRLAVFAADGTLIGWTSVEVEEATGATPTDRLATTGSSTLWLLAVAAAVLLVGTAAVLVARRSRARAEVGPKG